MKRISAAILILASAVLFAGAAVGGEGVLSAICMVLGMFLFITGIIEYNKACKDPD